jgi:hypothetical protein
MADANFRIKLSVAGVSEVTSGLKAVQSVAASASSMLSSIAALAGVTAGLAGFAAAIKQSVSFNAQLEQQSVAFRTLLGNAEAATARMKELSNFAAKTPFELPEVVNASKVLQSMTDGALAAGEGLRIVGDAAAASGRGLDEASMWIGRLYAGLNSGTPVGEATLRLLEMGLISGSTARRLNELAQSGEVAGNAFATIRETFAGFGGAMQAQSQTFNGLLSTLKDTVNMSMADIGRPLFDSIKGALTDAIPFVEEFGKNVAAFVQVAINAWKEGKFAELIGLTVEAGFEIGAEAAVATLGKIFDWLGSGSMWAAIGNGLFTAINEAMKGAANLIVDFLLVPLGAVGSFIEDSFGYAFEAAVDGFAVGLEKVINGAADLLNSAFGTSLGKVSLTSGKAFQAPDFMRSFTENQSGGQVIKDGVASFFDESTKAFRELVGVGSSLSVGTNGRDSIAQLIAQQRAMQGAQGADWQGPIQGGPDQKILNARLEAQKLELTVSKALQGINQSRAAVESTWLLSSVEKYKAKVRLLDEEKQLLEAQSAKLGELANAPGISATDRMQLLQDQQGVQGRIGQVDSSMGQMGPDPTSWTNQFASTFQSLADQAAITAQSVAQTFADVFNSAIASVSSGITGLIMGTQTWGQALMNIGTSILTSIVGAIVQMGVRWIATQILMATVGKSIMVASLAASAPIAAAQAAVWATPATLATIASYGAAASAAPGFIAASQGIVMAQSLAGFREGGFTGSGAPDEVAGIVHRGEFVIPADAVNRIGLDALEAMRAGESAGSAMPTSAASPGPITLNMGVFDNPARLNDWARSQEGRTVLVDIMRQHAHEMGQA